MTVSDLSQIPWQGWLLLFFLVGSVTEAVKSVANALSSHVVKCKEKNEDTN